MAFRLNLTDEVGAFRLEDLPAIYTPDMAVGPKAPNRRADVQLVQLMLRMIFAHPEFSPASRPTRTIRHPEDGQFGSITYDHILSFQRTMRRDGMPIHVDGRVDEFRGATHSRADKIYTVVWISFMFNRMFPAEMALGMSNLIDCPPELAAELNVFGNEPSPLGGVSGGAAGQAIDAGTR